METTEEERVAWFSLAPPGRLGFSADAGGWMEIAQKLGRDVDALEKAILEMQRIYFHPATSAAIARAVLKVEGPEMLTRQPVYQCHVCCPPGLPCPCDAQPHGEDEFCDCNHSLQT